MLSLSLCLSEASHIQDSLVETGLGCGWEGGGVKRYSGETRLELEAVGVFQKRCDHGLRDEKKRVKGVDLEVIPRLDLRR